uniref:Sushi domain-containing protein n=1 Tax=Anabas testudineus TaxID=64144 RepID=A0A3Q1GYN7_ANATE
MPKRQCPLVLHPQKASADRLVGDKSNSVTLVARVMLSPVGCGKPPTLPDGDLKYDIKFSYVNTEKVEYICQLHYTMQGEPFKTCNNGRWTGSMRCLRPCTVNTEDMNRHNIRFSHKTDDKLYLPHEDHITFSCIRGTVPDGRMEMRQYCNDGVMNLPTCSEEINQY